MAQVSLLPGSRTAHQNYLTTKCFDRAVKITAAARFIGRSGGLVVLLQEGGFAGVIGALRVKSLSVEPQGLSFFPSVRPLPAILTWEPAGALALGADLSFFGFLVSRLLRIWPFAMTELL
jgi:hypothetical protein